LLPVCLLVVVACAPSLPLPALTPPQRGGSVERTSEKRSEWLHRNCEAKGISMVRGKDDQWCDYNARCAAEKAGANVASIIYRYQDDINRIVTWDLMMFLCK